MRLIRTLKTLPRWAAAALAVVVTAGLMLLVAAQADASLFGGPPVTSVPGPYYNQGAVVGICVAIPGSGANTYVEVNTNFGPGGSITPNALGNCAGGHTQLIVPADPSLYPVPAPSSTGTGL